MKIATWNVERLKHKRELAEIIEACDSAKADILILTETDAQIQPAFSFSFHTPYLSEIDPTYYKSTENRVSIFTRYSCLRQHLTYDKYTSLCVELETEQGSLLVYGTIIGIYGNRHSNFKEDLPRQIMDFKRLSSRGQSLCIAGDFNQSFSDNYYFTKTGRSSILNCFDQIGVTMLTSERSWCIDHIALTDGFVAGKNVQVEEWNLDKRLSDHKGIMVEF